MGALVERSKSLVLFHGDKPVDSEKYDVVAWNVKVWKSIVLDM
jgi:hypothetical protein